MKYLISFFGLKRFGNHGIINWLKYNIPTKFKDYESMHINNAYDLYEKPPKIIHLNNIKPIMSGENYLLIISYEDVDLSFIEKIPSYKNQIRFFPDFNRVNIILLRDPFNFFASRLKMLRDMKKQDIRNPIQKVSWNKVKILWKQYAREFLGRTSFLGKNKVAINYDAWITDKKYRDKLLLKNFTKKRNKDLNIGKVYTHGRGSSFDYFKYDGQALKMNLLNRWKYYIGDQQYHNLTKDRELVALSNEIFAQLINFDNSKL